MKRLFLATFFLSLGAVSAQAGECHLQRNPIGFANYEVCEVEDAGYTCVSLEDKTRGGISCFPTPAARTEEVVRRPRY